MEKLWAGLFAASLAALAGCGHGESGTVIATSAITVPAGQEKRVAVTPSDLDGWSFRVVDPAGAPTGVGAFVSGPGTPPVGSGSASFSTVTRGNQAVYLPNTGFAGTPLSDITALSYNTYVVQWNGQQAPYIKLDVDLNNSGTVDDYLFFEPAYQTPATGNPLLPNQGAPRVGVWQTWDALVGGWWSTQGYAGATPGTGVKPLSTYLAAFPNARIINYYDGSGGIRLAVGLARPEDVFQGYVDSFTIGIRGGTVIFDFEPAQ